ncbi:hypothetical protein [Arthrobacter antioxidans]|uniref:hypothetical protein n=1 Tax=Arthrobacter antioxidans TaxID=2895818 RepID=UPI001FFEB3B2|nr:hypothetical protein [Arthrobacter antioxidans]
MFFKGSRYARTPEASMPGPDGHELHYKTTRFIEDAPATTGHIISGGERLDLIAYFYYRLPDRFWRICDANAVMDPSRLEQDVGRKINIPESP